MEGQGTVVNRNGYMTTVPREEVDGWVWKYAVAAVRPLEDCGH
jgi:hypothetical protein